ncbi:uncharacterized protein LOC129958797 [Argiope bruennichi]|uniref:uncharacterized protein LOC129958797 n=1 Tax=Argiope bruennichi TaxID=94029 RepID=UPI00249415E0|nr:uncharacterized protein LOC129958797 [Argiope bruennichi]
METPPNLAVRPHLSEPVDLDVEYPLQELSLRKLLVILWTQDDVISAIQKFQCTSSPLDRMMIIWRNTVEIEVQRKILNIGLPSRLEKKMKALVKPMGCDILKWKLFHEHYFSHANGYMGLHFLKQLQWTKAGAIDYGKTAEKLIRLEMLDIVERYKIACFYCLSDDIPLLWEALPENTKSTFTNEDISSIADAKLEYYWPYVLRNEEDDLILKRISEDETPLYMWAFQTFTCLGNKPAVEYFYQKLPKGREDACLFRAMKAIIESQEWFITPEWSVTYPQGRLSDVLCYIFPLMRIETQWHVLEHYTRGVLSCFLEWPCHDLFLKLADTIWEKFPSEEMYRHLLNTISNPGYYQYFPDLFQSFFIKTPAKFKKHFIDYEMCYLQYFQEFYNNGDAESIEVVFKNTEYHDKLRLIASRKFFNLFFNPSRSDRWHLAELCLIESAYSEEDREKMKKVIEGVLVGDGTTTFQNRKNALRQAFLFFFDVRKGRVVIKRRSPDKERRVAKKMKKE